MISLPDPNDLIRSPTWQALHREGMLVRGLLCSAANAIGKASYADRLGEYYTAFFGFSLGIERLAKLCIAVDHAISHNGSLPSPTMLAGHRHNVAKLIGEVRACLDHNGMKPHYPYPNLPICQNIVECLRSFAEAREGRYANFDALGNPNFDPAKEPVNKWWAEVAKPILASHFEGTKAQKRALSDASMIEAALGPFSYVAHTDEAGQPMSNLQAASYRTAEAKIVQKYGRYYTLLLVRWLGSAFRILSLRAFEQGASAFFGHWELFYTFTTDDVFLRERRAWPLS